MMISVLGWQEDQVTTDGEEHYEMCGEIASIFSSGYC